MKSLKRTLFTLSLLALAAPSFAQSVSCKVVGVSDGDTLTCLGAGNVQYKTRLFCKVSRLDGDGDGVPCESLCR